MNAWVLVAWWLGLVAVVTAAAALTAALTSATRRAARFLRGGRGL